MFDLTRSYVVPLESTKEALRTVGDRIFIRRHLSMNDYTSGSPSIPFLESTGYGNWVTRSGLL